jgi:hypothetical protein
MKEILSAKFTDISLQVSSAFLLCVSAGLVCESEIIKTQLGKHNRSVMVALYGDALWDTTLLTANVTVPVV